MGRQLQPATLVTIDDIDEGIKLLKQALGLIVGAKCPQTEKKVRAAIKSAEGASRHAWRRHRATQTEPGIPMRNMRDFDKL